MPVATQVISTMLVGDEENEVGSILIVSGCHIETFVKADENLGLRSPKEIDLLLSEISLSTLKTIKIPSSL